MHENELSERSRSAARARSRPPARAVGAAAPVRDRAGPEIPGLPRGGADVLALQRTAGNAAVTRALAARRHVGDAAPGHGLPVQRVLRNNQRQFGPGQLRQPRAKDQEHLEKVFPKTATGANEQFPNPITIHKSLIDSLSARLNKVPQDEVGTEGPAAWVKGINSQRAKKDGYERNCIDAARSFMASWSGNPTVAAPVHDKGKNDVETDGPDRTKQWLGTNWRTTEAQTGQQVQDRWQVVANRLRGSGHGAASIVVFRNTKTNNVHAVNGVNHNDRVVWIDPQQGLVSDTPPYEGDMFMTITLDRHFAPVDPP
ncbi:toxin glutamine deamidase domain-containing protein [Streptomyces sp. NPDC048057]|uniref:toxin glutamine deamidase domain-containing protein n=1 Tax=Streptomyces sp. NPDC048057 TaxID=3155628 RepID=UPI0033ED5583